MSGGGGNKKTKTKQEFKLPAWYEDAAKSAIGFSEDVAKGGYVPWLGPDVAALSPNAKAGIAGTNAMSEAFGMPFSSDPYLPPEQEFAGGVKGYSGFGGFEDAMEALKAKYPGMYDFLAKYNKISQGSSINPTQSTAFQEQLSPQFNAMMNMFQPKQSIPGGKGPESMVQTMLMGGK